MQRLQQRNGLRGPRMHRSVALLDPVILVLARPKYTFMYAAGGTSGPSSPAVQSPSPPPASPAAPQPPPPSGPVICSNTTGAVSVVSSLASDFSSLEGCSGNYSRVTDSAYYVLNREDGYIWCIEQASNFLSFCFNATDFLSASNLALCST